MQRHLPCKVCGLPSVGVNVEVKSCAACKSFFRRNAHRSPGSLTCRMDKRCDVRRCPGCRIKKCFNVGMKIDLIRPDRVKSTRSQFQSRTSGSPEPSTTSPVEETISLSPADQTLLNKIDDTYNQICLSKSWSHIQLGITDNGTYNLNTFLRTCCEMHRSLIEFLKQIPEFARLPMDIRMQLIKHNLNLTLPFNEVLVAQNVYDHNNSMPTAYLRTFGLELCIALQQCRRNIYLNLNDPILLKFLLIILMFSTRLSTIKEGDESASSIDSRTVFAAQNIYVDLLWRYISNRYAGDQQAVQMLFSFVTGLLYSQLVQKQLEIYVSQTNSKYIDTSDPLIEIMWLRGNQI